MNWLPLLAVAWEAPQNLTSVLEWAQWLNTVTAPAGTTYGLFWTVFVFMFFVIAFVAMKRFVTERAFLSASVSTFFVSLLLISADLIPAESFGITVALVLVGLLASYMSTRKD